MDYYNAPWKLAYIKDTFGPEAVDGVTPAKELPRRTKYSHVTSALKQVAEFETKVDTDFAYFTDDDMKSVYLNFADRFANSTLKEKYSDLKSYVSWCANTGRITLNDFYSHPLYKAFLNGYNHKKVGQEGRPECRSKRISEQQRLAKKDYTSNSEDCIENFIFKTPDELFKYVNTIFAESRYLMCRASLFLMYYGFSNAEIPTIRRDEVNDATHEVRGVKIDDVPFQTMLEAKYNDTFISENGRVMSYKDTVYLIHSFKSTGMISYAFLKNMKRKVKEALKELPVSSPYKNINIFLNWLSKQGEFHRIQKNEADKTELEIVDILKKTQKYNLSFPDYLTMAAKARDI